jgi:hypothetical protein
MMVLPRQIYLKIALQQTKTLNFQLSTVNWNVRSLYVKKGTIRFSFCLHLHYSVFKVRIWKTRNADTRNSELSAAVNRFRISPKHSR